MPGVLFPAENEAVRAAIVRREESGAVSRPVPSDIVIYVRHRTAVDAGAGVEWMRYGAQVQLRPVRLLPQAVTRLAAAVKGHARSYAGA